MNFKEFFPDNFLLFLKENDIDIDNFNLNNNIPRYFRIKKEFENEDFLKNLEKELEVKLIKKNWYPDTFYSINDEIKISNNTSYKEGKIYGMVR
jgi:hypothetical protein